MFVEHVIQLGHVTDGQTWVAVQAELEQDLPRKKKYHVTPAVMYALWVSFSFQPQQCKSGIIPLESLSSAPEHGVLYLLFAVKHGG